MAVNFRHWRSGMIPTPLCNFEAPKENGTGGDPPPQDDDIDLDAIEVTERRRRRSENGVPTREELLRDYMRDLRGEARSYRMKMQDEARKRQEAEAAATAAADKALKDLEEARTAAQAEATTKVTEAETRAAGRVIRAELRALATKAGMVDLDGLKLADISTVKIENDEVVGGDEMIAKLKEAKPYLFGTATGTTDTRTVPPKPGDKAKSVKEMDRKEYEAARKAALR